MTEVVEEELGHPERVAALSGPNHAEEICRGTLAAAVVASEHPGVVAFFKDCLLYTSAAADDLLCVNIGRRRISKQQNNQAR